ncbi:MAG: hypothetical protein HY898_28770 [Deltaproteobacteria bacterium]|nr:hypothetical protein [Deltaproteobacteria bacterium]
MRSCPRSCVLAVACALLASACGSSEPTASNASNGGSGGAGGSAAGASDGGLIDTGKGGSIPMEASPGDSQGDACVADELQAKLVKKPVDVIVVIDTSSTMKPASDAVESNINDNLAAVLTAGNVDYRLVVVAEYGSGAKVCIGPPLGGAPCTPTPPAVPANTPTFFHYARGTGSGGFLAAIIAYYNQADPYNLAPAGYSQWLRPEALKVFLAFTDTSSSSSLSSTQFDTQLLALQPAVFGTAQARNYVFHSIIGLKENNPPTSAWLPSDPVVSGTCTGGNYSGDLGAGKPLQEVSILTGGLRFPICQFASFDVVFKELAKEVVAVTPVACDFPFPEPPAGKTIDPDTIQLDYTPGNGGAPQTFKQVASAAACNATSFYVEGTTIHLCPQACTVVSADETATIRVRYGCDVGFVH